MCVFNMNCYVTSWTTKNPSTIQYVKQFQTQYVMSRIYLCLRSHGTYIHEARHTYGCVMSHVWISHATHMIESCHTYTGVKPHIWMCHVAHMNEASCRTHECVMSHTLMFMSHIRMSHDMRMKESCHVNFYVTHCHVGWRSHITNNIFIFQNVCVCECIRKYQSKMLHHKLGEVDREHTEACDT